MDDSIGGRVAVVTGGTGGIGAAICSALAEASFTVVIGYNSSSAQAETLARELPGTGHMALPAPVTDSPALAVLAATVGDRFGRVDLLVNCAGMTRFVEHGNLDALDDALIDAIFNVNVRGVIAATRAFRPLLKEAPDGLVVNISSIAGVTAMGSNIAYCASKAAVDNLTRSLARALAPEIRVVSVSPGLVDGDYAQSFDPAWRNAQVERTPMKRLATPQDVGAAIVAVANDLPFTTGAIIPVDGGRPLA